jgi:hypothetical protein
VKNFKEYIAEGDITIQSVSVYSPINNRNIVGKYSPSRVIPLMTTEKEFAIVQVPEYISQQNVVPARELEIRKPNKDEHQGSLLLIKFGDKRSAFLSGASKKAISMAKKGQPEEKLEYIWKQHFGRS